MIFNSKTTLKGSAYWIKHDDNNSRFFFFFCCTVSYSQNVYNVIIGGVSAAVVLHQVGNMKETGLILKTALGCKERTEIDRKQNEELIFILLMVF